MRAEERIRKRKEDGGGRRRSRGGHRGMSYTAKGGGAVYMYEVVRVHVKMCAGGARARAVDFREQAKQGSEIARGVWYMASAIIRGQDDAGPDHLP